MGQVAYAWLSLVGILLALVALLVGRLVRQIRTLPLRPGSVVLRRREDLPEDLLPTFAAAEEGLAARGFRFAHCGEVASPFRIGQASLWVWVFTHPEERCSASLVNSELPDAYFPCHISFGTRYPDGTLLLTVNGREHQYMPGLPGVTIRDAWASDLEGHWQAHRQAAARRGGPEGRQRPLTPEEAVAADQAFMDAIVDHVRGSGWVEALGPATYRFRRGAALRLAGRLLRGERRLARLRGRMGCHLSAQAPVPMADEMTAYRRLEALSRTPPSGWLLKAVLFLASLVLFGLALGLSLEPRTVLILVGALLLHELGHLVAMRRYGYRDVQVLFLPFLGAIALAEEHEVRAYQRVIVYLAGPLPGLVLGYALVHVPGVDGPLLHEVALVLLVLNGFNLLPFMPLDGGQVLGVVLFERFPRVQAAFTWLSAGALALGAWSLSSPPLGLLALLVGLLGAVQRREADVLGRLARRPPSARDEQARLREVLGVLREPPFGRLPFAHKFPLARAVLRRGGREAASGPLAVASLAVYAGALLLTVSLALGRLALPSAVESVPDWEAEVTAARSTEQRWAVVLAAGDWFAEREDDASAREYYARAVGIAEGFGAVDLRLAESLAREASYAEDPELARALYGRALSVQEQVLGPEHPEVAATLEGLAWTYGEDGEGLDRAIDLRLRALAIHRRHQPERPEAVAEGLAALAATHEARGALDPAESSLREALEIYEAISPGGDWRTDAAGTALARFYLRHARYRDAARVLTRALVATGPETRGYRLLTRSEGESLLGWAWLLEGDAKSAQGWFEAALEDHEGACCGGCADISLVPRLLDLAHVHADRAEPVRARAYLERAAAILHEGGESLAEHAAGLERRGAGEGGAAPWPAVRLEAHARTIRSMLGRGEQRVQHVDAAATDGAVGPRPVLVATTGGGGALGAVPGRRAGVDRAEGGPDLVGVDVLGEHAGR